MSGVAELLAHAIAALSNVSNRAFAAWLALLTLLVIAGLLLWLV